MMNLSNSTTLLCNVWDVTSAKVAENLGFKWIGTSSGAIASMLGYPDGEYISFEELCYIVKRITANVKIPLSVDMEAGYSRNPKEVVNNIQELQKLGIVGINLEDSLMIEGKRVLQDSNRFSLFLKQVVNDLRNTTSELFINVRTDSFLLASANAMEETIRRAAKYKEAGADGLFVPCIESGEGIKILVDRINLPLNVMAMPNLPDFEQLKEYGVQRISMGNFVFNQLEQTLKSELNEILHNNSFKSIFQ